MLIGEYVQQFEPGITDANNIANSALVQSQEALDQAKNATAIANEALGQSRASVIELINSVNASTVTLIGNKNDGSQTTTNLPVASELQAGVMNTATYVNLKDLNSRVTSLESNTTTYIVVLPNDTPTQAEILNAYRTAYPLAPNPPLDGTTVIDVDKQLFYRYVKNGNIWIKTSGFNVTPFTNENAGIIKGSTTPGQVQAETDGTGSLVGYDTLVSNIAQNTTAIGTANSRIDAVETKNTEQDTTINRAQTVANSSYGGFGVTKTPQDVKLNLTRNNGDIDTFPILPVDTQNAGIVTPTMFNQWNQGGDIFPVNFTLSYIFNAHAPINVKINSIAIFNIDVRKSGGTIQAYVNNITDCRLFKAETALMLKDNDNLFTFSQGFLTRNTSLIVEHNNKIYQIFLIVEIGDAGTVVNTPINITIYSNKGLTFDTNTISSGGGSA